MTDLQPWTIAAFAGFGVLIAYFQWRTAHQRVVLDLFDRRLKIFEMAEGACASIVASGKADQNSLVMLHRAKANARFLFGEDANVYLKSRIADVAFLLSFTSEVINERPPEERQILIEKKYAALQKVASFSEDAPPIFRRYMLMKQKAPNTWLPI